MAKKYKNKYRIASIRLKNWDYRTNGAYFITICTGNRKHFFGEIVKIDNKKTMVLNEIGAIAENFWIEIPKHFPFVELGNFVVMPNHIHGILIINNFNSTENGCFINSDFNWQSKFYDVIINNSISFERIQTYIENNPSNWKEDKFYN